MIPHNFGARLGLNKHQNPGKNHHNQVNSQIPMDKNQSMMNNTQEMMVENQMMMDKSQRQYQTPNQFQNLVVNPAPITINNQAQYQIPNISDNQTMQKQNRQNAISQKPVIQNPVIQNSPILQNSRNVASLMGPPQSARHFQSQSYDDNYSIDGPPNASRPRLATDLHETRRVLIQTASQIHTGSYYDTSDNYMMPDDNQIQLDDPIYDGTDWISIVYNESKFESSDVKSLDFLRLHGFLQLNESPQADTPPSNTAKPGSFQNNLKNESARSSLSNQSNPPSSESPNPNHDFTQDNFNRELMHQDSNQDSTQETNQNSFDESNKIYITLEEFKADIKSPRVSITNDCETVRNQVDENPDLEVNKSMFLLGQVHNISRPKWVTNCRRFIGKGVSFELLDYTPGSLNKKYNTRLSCNLPCQFSSVYYEICIPNLVNPFNQGSSHSTSMMNSQANSAIGSEINGHVYSKYPHQLQNNHNHQNYLTSSSTPPITNTPTSSAQPQSTIFQLKTGQQAEVHDFDKFTQFTDLKIKDFTEIQIKRITDFYNDPTNLGELSFMDNFDENLDFMLSEKSLQMRQYCSIRLSFIKKFGEKSKYPHINLVPCWIDVTLEIPKRYLRKKLEDCKEELLEVLDRFRDGDSGRSEDENGPRSHHYNLQENVQGNIQSGNHRGIQGGVQVGIQGGIQADTQYN